MSDIKIFVTHTPNKNSMCVQNPLFYQVIAGSDFQTDIIPEGMYQDNTGDNISCRNKSYCELTTQYWAWKNMDADYYGFCHYRRFFSFSKEQIEESCWGTIEYDYLDETAIKALELNEDTMRERIEQYDFLIAKGVAASSMQSDNIYNHYKNAAELHIEDVDLLLEIIKEKYEEMYETAVSYFNGTVFWPCNMFIMKKEIFQTYSEILFDILDEFEKRSDMKNYSREAYRTIGHLGERMAGIYYMYLQKQGKYKMGELQIALIHHAEAEKEVSVMDDKAVPVVLAANQKYIPILYTCLHSVVANMSENRNYDIYIFHTDIAPDSQRRIESNLGGKNRRLTFINVSKNVSGYILCAKQHITTETFYRFLILDILKDYHKVIYLDCDMLIKHDIAELFDIDLKDTYIAATVDSDFAGQCNMKNSDMRDYCNKVLGLDDPFQYFQAGVLVFNVDILQKITSVQELFEMSDTGQYRFSDQDILNIICKGKVTYLDMRWNVLCDCNHSRWKDVLKYAPHYMLDSYEQARKNPYIIHYAGFLKPWMKPDEDFAEEFWNEARLTIYYEQLLSMMYEYSISDLRNREPIIQNITHQNITQQNITQVTQVNSIFLRLVRKIARHILPPDTKIRAWAARIYHKFTGGI